MHTVDADQQHVTDTFGPIATTATRKEFWSGNTFGVIAPAIAGAPSAIPAQISNK
jgi:hypothetical protein